MAYGQSGALDGLREEIEKLKAENVILKRRASEAERREADLLASARFAWNWLRPKQQDILYGWAQKMNLVLEYYQTLEKRGVTK